MLDDGDLLLEFYDRAGVKQGIKRFIKRQRWPGKPALPYSLGTDAMRSMLLNLLNAPAGRRLLLERSEKTSESLALHQVIWSWSCQEAEGLEKIISEHGVEIKDRIFLRPDGLKNIVDDFSSRQDWDQSGKRLLAHVVLAYAMLQPEDSIFLAEIFLEKAPELGEGFGLQRKAWVL